MTEKPLKKLLIVDDDKDIMQILKYSLEEMQGVDIRYEYSGEKGITQALAFIPDLMLIDVMMPGMTGIEMIQAMRLIPSLAEIPVVFLTAKMQREEIENYRSMGVKDIITKPFDPMTLGEQIFAIWDSKCSQ